MSESPQKEVLQNFIESQRIDWPSIRKTPINKFNKFNTPGYFSMAFPHLFPYGRGAFTVRKDMRIKFSEYI